MGANCSCMGSKSDKTEEVECPDAEVPLENKPEVPSTTPMQMQSAFRGYSARKKGCGLKNSRNAMIPSNENVKLAEAKIGPFMWDESDKNKKMNDPETHGNDIYIGQISESGQKNGRGILMREDGSKYIGYFENDKAQGRGRLIYKEGDVYEGEWSEDQANGKGKYIHFDGAVYDGDWVNDKQEGEGFEKWTDGSYYKGGYENGQKHGYGEIFWADGSVYKGDFDKNNIQGKGTYVWEDNRKFEGEWFDNKMHGYGVFTWEDGRVFSGNYVMDKKEGYGVFVWPDGKEYKGGWKNGNQHGIGTMTIKGKSREGEWNEGKRERWIPSPKEDESEASKKPVESETSKKPEISGDPQQAAAETETPGQLLEPGEKDETSEPSIVITKPELSVPRSAAAEESSKAPEGTLKSNKSKSGKKKGKKGKKGKKSPPKASADQKKE